MARTPRRTGFTLNPQEDQTDFGYDPSRFSPRSKVAHHFDLNDERFAPKSDPVTMEQDEEETDPYNDIITRYRKELGSEQPALAQYRSALQNTPRQQDYDLGKWGKLGAALSGFGAGWKDPAEGIKVATTLREAPWRKALEQHDKDLENLGTQAGFEQDDRKNRMAGIKLELETEGARRKEARENATALSQNDRRAAQTEIDLKKLGMDATRLNMDWYNTLTDNQREALLAQNTIRHTGVQEEQTDYSNKTGRINAGTAIGNLRLGERKQDFDEDVKFPAERVDAYTNYSSRERGHDIAERGNSYSSPSDQRTAKDAVAEEMYTDPVYRQFFKPNAKADNRIELKDDLPEAVYSSPAYQAMLAELRRRQDNMINRRRGGGTTNRSRYNFLDPESQPEKGSGFYFGGSEDSSAPSRPVRRPTFGGDIDDEWEWGDQ